MEKEGREERWREKGRVIERETERDKGKERA